jgi:hypothetical protein
LLSINQVHTSESTDLALSDFPADPQALHLQVNLFFKKMWQSSLPWPLAYCLLAHFVYVWFLLSISQINRYELQDLAPSHFPADPQALHLQVKIFLCGKAHYHDHQLTVFKHILVCVWFLLSISQINPSELTDLALSDFPADSQTLHLQVNLFLTNCAKAHYRDH